jgi:eukaryotic-like serine/threonine-protein kinase
MADAKPDEEAIFNAIRLQDAPEARRAYLDEVCGGDQAVRARVEALLRVHDAERSFLATPAGAPSATVDLPHCEVAGVVIGPYKLIEQIGEGGMGTVWMAQQHEPVRRVVALKLIKAGMDSKQVIARFEAERQALALMDHANIAHVLDGGTSDGGRPYFVMDLVKGVPITRYCDEQHLTPHKRLELFIPVCQAVQHAHQKGVIHRDLKPSNVLVALYDGKPVPKVIDFGVAKAAGQSLTEKTLATGFGAIVGTLEYMSPEQAEINQLDVDTRSDIYSLGVLLYELLTGATPFSRKELEKAGMLEMLRLIREQDPSKPSTKLSTAEGLPMLAANRGTEPAKLMKLLRGELDWIVMKALEKDRSRRYETANGFAADVRRYLGGETVLAVPPSASYRLGKLARRNRAALVMGSVIAGALLTTVVALGVSNWRVHEKQLQTNAALEQTRVEKKQKSEQLWHALVAQARANQLSRRAGQRFETLEILKQATELARTLDLPEARFHELRNVTSATLTLPDLHLAGPWNPWPTDGYDFDFDEAHALYARTDRRGNCSVRRVADNVEVHLLPGLGVLAGPYFSRDGKFLALTHYTEGPAARSVAVQLWGLETTAARMIRSEENGRYVDFHPNGRQVGVAYSDGTIRLFELPSGQPLGRPLAPNILTREVNFALHPTEPVVAVSSYFGSVVQFRDLNTGEVLAVLPQDGRAMSLAWRPDGATLAIGLDTYRIRLYDRARRQVVRTLETDQRASSIGFNHVGDRLASTSWGPFMEMFDVGTGQKLFTTTNMRHRGRFSRDDRRLAGAIQDGKLGVWQVGDGRECRTLVRKDMPDKSSYANSSSVSPDGRLLAAAMTDGFGIWDMLSGDELKFIPTGGGFNLVLFEPSGALLALCPTGLFRWPIAKESSAAGPWVMGPPERLPLPLGQSRDGRVIVTCSRAINIEHAHAGGWILHADRPDQPIRLDPGADIVHIAVSPDGYWIVTVVQSSGLAKVWDARDGKLVTQLAEWGSGYPRFSPDSRWLSTDLDGGRLFAVGTWEPGPRVGGAGAFAPDGKLLAVVTGAGSVRLVDPATGRELSVLEDLSQDGTTQPSFAPDGTKLIARTRGKVEGIRVWDLRLIRQHLARIGLDWDAPPYPPAEAGKTLVPLKLEVRLGDLAPPPKSPVLSRDQKAKQDIEGLRRVLGKEPDNAKACNNLAWVFLTAPGALCDVKAAMPLAEQAVRLAPGNATYAITLGVAYYRNSRYREAVDILRPNLARAEDGSLAFDLYFLAMSHHKLGETVQAQLYLDWADRWARTDHRLTQEHVDELEMFRSEATKVLGVADRGGVKLAPPPRVKK